MAKWRDPKDIKRIKAVKAKLDAKKALPQPKPELTKICLFPDARSNVKRDALDTESYEEKPEADKITTDLYHRQNKPKSKKRSSKSKKKNDRN